jgi:PEGA domain-containing protein
VVSSGASWRVPLSLLVAVTGRAAEFLVIESHVGSRPAEAPTEMRGVVQTLGDRALHDDPLADAVELQLSCPAGEAIAAEDVAEIVRGVDLAQRAYAAGDFEGATGRLTAILRRLESSPAALLHDLALRRALQQARLLLGDIDRRVGRRAEGTALMADAIRADPGSDPSAMTFNPDLIAFFKSVRRELGQQPRGSLEVLTQPPGLMVYLNDEFVGLSPVHKADLYPGRHKVVIEHKESRTRVHEARVQGDERMTIDADFDAALRTRPWVGLWFGSEAARAQHEAEYAARIGRALRTPRVVVVASGDYRDRPALIGSLVDVETARPVRTGIVALDPRPPDETLRALGRFLAVGEAGPGVIVAGAESAAANRRPYRRWKWVAAAAALFAAGAGAALVAGDCSGETPGGTCIERRGTKLPGLVLLGLAGATGLTAGILFYYDDRDAGAGLAVEF